MAALTNGRRLRVLHVIQNLNYGGMERMLSDLVRGMAARSIESHVLVLQYLGRFAEGLGDVAELHEAPAQPPWSLLWPEALASTIRAIAPDVAHSHSGVWYKTSLAARLAGVRRMIHTEHGRPVPDPWSARALDGAAARRTSAAVAVSRSVADLLEQRIVRGRCPIHVVVNGVDTCQFEPVPDTGALRAELGLDRDTPILGSIGRLEPIKGYEVMVAAFAQLLARSGLQPEPVLVIAGDGSERARLEAQITGLGLRRRVHFLGWRDDVKDLLSAFTCFTMSSHSEGTSMSLLEAMASGLCPVVTNVGGNAAILGNDLAHRLVRADDPSALAAAWHRLLTSRDERARDAVSARARVEADYSARAMIQSYCQLYHADGGRGDS